MIQRSEQARTSGSRPRARGLPRRTAIFLVTALSGCSSAETVSPVPTETTTETPTETPTATTTTTPPDGSPAKRTVSLRSPLAGPANNLLLDGDFELSTSYGTGQYGWRMFNANGTGEIPMTVETGGLCRTGLTCVRVQRGQIFFGRGTAAAGGKSHFMDLWARMPEGVGCAKIAVIAVECDTFSVLKQATADKELEGGWCRHHGVFKASASAVCVYIQTSLLPGDVALLDSGVLGPDDGTVTLKATESEPLDGDTLARMANVRDYLRRTTVLGVPAPTAPRP